MKIENNRVTCLDWVTDKEEWDKLVSEDNPEGRYTIMVSVTQYDQFQRLTEDVLKFVDKYRELLNKLIDKHFEEWLSEHKGKVT